MPITNTLQNYYTATGLTTGVKVNVQISASNINGEGQLSDVRTYYVATVPGTPVAPTETKIFLADYSSESGALQVSWLAPVTNGAPITGYRLYFAEEGQEF